MSAVLTEDVTEITDALIAQALSSPAALASKIIRRDDPRYNKLIAAIKAEMPSVRRCPCVGCERDLDDPREQASLEILPVGDGFVRLHMCCEDCIND